MQVEVYKIYPVTSNQKIKAYVDIMLAESLIMTNLRVIDGAGGLFVAYPHDPDHKGDDYRQMFYPITRELREQIEGVVLDAYKKEMEEQEHKCTKHLFVVFVCKNKNKADGVGSMVLENTPVPKTQEEVTALECYVLGKLGSGFNAVIITNWKVVENTQ